MRALLEKTSCFWLNWTLLTASKLREPVDPIEFTVSSEPGRYCEWLRTLNGLIAELELVALVERDPLDGGQVKVVIAAGGQRVTTGRWERTRSALHVVGVVVGNEGRGGSRAGESHLPCIQWCWQRSL